jgi:glycosyltransferase involved in cell wall biosynthesis
MRICVDATALLLRSAGVKNYFFHWINALRAEGRNHTINAFPLIPRAESLDHEKSVLKPWQTLPRIALLHFVNIPYNPAIDVLTAGMDVFHASNQVHNIPRRSRLTATVHDLTVKLMPQLHTPGNVRAETRFYEAILKRADGLLADSESTKQDAVSLLGIHPDKISVVYPGVDERFFQSTTRHIELACRKHGLGKPYILFVGTIEPRKNVDILLDAYAQLPTSLRDHFELVVAGPVGWAAGPTVNRLRSKLPGVRLLGYVPERDLPAITAGATVFVYPSLYEGFGFPVAQAMAAGVPVITSNISSLPEVVGDAALLIDPRSSSELRAAMDRVLTSPAVQEQLGKSAQQRARSFTWKKAAVESFEFFGRVVSATI